MKQKLLILSPFLPWPLNTGGNAGVYNMLKSVVEDYEVHFVTSMNNINKPEYVKLLTSQIKGITFHLYDYKKANNKKFEYFRKIVRRLQLRMNFEESINALSFNLNDEITPDYIEFVKDIIYKNNIDLVQVEFCSYLPWVYALPKSVRKIFIHHELRYVRDSQEYEKNTYGAYLTDFAKDNEISMLNRFDRIVSLTSIDKEKLEKEGVRVPIYVSTLAITDNTPDFTVWKSSNRLSFVGGSGHSPNYEGIKWFVMNVLPLVQKQISDVKLDIIGSWSPESQKEILNLSSAVEFKGFVPSLIDGIKNTLMIVPINIGSGIRMKILESSSNSVPFVSTVVGVEGLDFESGKDCYIAKDKDEMAKQIVTVLENPDIYASLSKNAYDTFVSKYSFDAMKKMRLNVYVFND